MNEQIEVPVRAEIPLSKYLARIPKALFLKGRSHCDRKGISLNTLITIALRDYLDAGDIDVPTQPKLSQVFKDELAAMAARLMAVLDPEGLRRVHQVRISMDTTVAQAQLHELRRAVDEQKGWTSSIGTRPASTREGASFVSPAALDWDSPAPQHRLWPDNPPVNGLAPEQLRGQVWVVTGSFETMTSSRVREILQQAGAVVATTVNKKTSAVLAGYSPESEKLDAAEAQMLPVWGELQFLHMAKFIGADVRIPV